MSFRIVKKTSLNKTIRMPEELIAKLEILASLNDVSFNQVVVQACQYALENLEEPERSKVLSKPGNAL